MSGIIFGFVQIGYAQSVQDWTDPVNLSNTGSASNPSIIVDSHGVLHVLWFDQFDGYKYTQSTDGITWITPVTVRFPFPPTAPPPVLFTDEKGIIHIFWMDDENQLFYAQTMPENLSTPASWCTKASIDSSVYDFDAAMDPQGRMHVTYLKNPAPPADASVPAPIPAAGIGGAGAFYRGSRDGGRVWDAPKLLYESPYFQFLTAENAHIRMAVSDRPEDDRVCGLG